MAKLHGVKVIDMVGGEVTKIAYDGEEYAKVDGVGKAGDIGLRVANDRSWARVGEYFTMKGQGSSIQYADNHGGTPAVNPKQWAFFRKTSAQPTLTDRVATLESKVAALEEGAKAPESLVGKFAKFNTDGLDVTAGNYYEIIEVDGGDILVVDDMGDNHWFTYPSIDPDIDYEIVDERLTQTIEGDPQVGDKIRIVNAVMTAGHYENGDVLTVRQVGSGDYPTAIRPEEFDHCIYRKEFEIISRPEKAEEPALKVGDYAKVIGSTNGFCKVGDFVKVIETDASFVPFKVELLDGSYAGWQDGESLRKATDEEVAEAKRKLAEEQEAEAEVKKWAEIGRKPNEFKAGDIVKLNQGSGAHEKGAIVEVISENYYRDSEGDTYGGEFEWYDIITPVERRFDR